MTARFNLMRVPQLRDYLRDRAISVTGYSKVQLIRLAETAEEIGLPTDVDLQLCPTVTDKVTALGLGFTDPFSVSGFSEDLSSIPCLSMYDIFNFLIHRRSDYDRRKIKAYKSYEDYRLFNDGYVESVQFNPLHNNDIYCLFKCQVKPTQKDKTYLNKTRYELWILMEKTGDIALAYCQCPGGYRMSESDTDRDRPYCDTFDPRQAMYQNGPSEENIRTFTQQLMQINPNIQVLDILTEPMETDENETIDPLTTLDQDCLEFSMESKAIKFIKDMNRSSSCSTCSNQEFIDTRSLMLSQEDIASIEESTRGQSENSKWFEMRKGRITASNFRKVVCHTRSNRSAPSLLQTLTDGNSAQDSFVPSLNWGHKKEKVAKAIYKKALQKVHKRLQIKESGLVVSAEHPFLACSPDGIVSCQCKSLGHEPRLLEVKCPYSNRHLSAKQAALEKGCSEINSTLTLTKQSEYYHQVQGQLGICGFSLCHLVIYTSRGIEVIEVNFNTEFYQSMVFNLSEYFKTEMVPALLHEKE